MSGRATEPATPAASATLPHAGASEPADPPLEAQIEALAALCGVDLQREAHLVWTLKQVRADAAAACACVASFVHACMHKT